MPDAPLLMECKPYSGLQPVRASPNGHIKPVYSGGVNADLAAFTMPDSDLARFGLLIIGSRQAKEGKRTEISPGEKEKRPRWDPLSAGVKLQARKRARSAKSTSQGRHRRPENDKAIHRWRSREKEGREKNRLQKWNRQSLPPSCGSLEGKR